MTGLIERVPVKGLRHMVRLHLKYARRPRRYRRLLQAAATHRPQRILEIGVYDGRRGVEMIEAASLGASAATVEYHGFDLFDAMDEAILKSELSKRPDPEAAVHARLAATGASVALHQGWSQETLPALAAAAPEFRADLAFIDGGHAVETIQSDWDNVIAMLAPDGIVLLDDFYVDCPHLTPHFGCNQMVESLDPEVWQVTRHAEVDRFVHDGQPHNVAIVEVCRRGRREGT